MIVDGQNEAWTGNHDSIGEDAMSSPVLPVLLVPSISSGIHNEATPTETVEGSPPLPPPPQPLSPPPPYTTIKMREICHRPTDDESGGLLEPSYNREALAVPSELQSRISLDDWTEFWSVHMQPLYDDGQLYTRYFVGTAVAIILVFVVLFFAGLNLNINANSAYVDFAYNLALVAALCVANYRYNGWIARVRYRQLTQIRAMCRKQEHLFQNVRIQCDYEWFYGDPHDIVMVMYGVVLYFYPKNPGDAIKDDDCGDNDDDDDIRRIQLFSTDPNGWSRSLSVLRSHLESYRYRQTAAALQCSPCDRVATTTATAPECNDNDVWSVQFWPTMMQHCIAYSSAYYWDTVAWRLVYLLSLVNFFFLDDVPLLSDTAELLSNIVLFPIVLALANFYTPVPKHTCVRQCRSWVQRHAAALQEQYGIHVEFRQVYEFKGGNTACGTMSMYGAHYLCVCPAGARDDL